MSEYKSHRKMFEEHQAQQASEEEMRQERLRRAKRARQWMTEAKEEYHSALTDCFDAYISSSRVARELGLSEAAVRMYKTRHNL